MLIHLKCVIITLLFMSTVKSSFQCELPNGCTLKKYIDLIFLEIRYFFCDQIDAKFDIGFIQSQLDQCHQIKYKNVQYLRIHMKTSNRIILNESFDFEGLYLIYAEAIVKLNIMFSVEFIFSELKGFDINSFNQGIGIKQKFQKDLSRLEMWIYDSSFEFYYRNKRIKSCEDYTNAIESSEIRGENIFQACAFPCSFRLKRVDFSTPICPLAFNNSNITILTVNELIDTFYRTNSLRFLESNLSIVCFIGEVSLVDVNKINLDKNLDVFKNMKYFSAYGILESVQVELFLPENFPLLKNIVLGLTFFRPLIHRKGIDWIQAKLSC